MQNRGAKKQEGGLIWATLWLGCANAANGAVRTMCCERCAARAEPMRYERCVASDALRTMRAMRCGSEGALVVLLQVLCYRVGDEGESIHVPSLRPVGVNLCRFLH